MKTKILAALALCFFSRICSAELVVIVNPKTVENAISLQDAANVFLGRKTVLGEGSRVAPVDQAEGSAARNLFYQRVADKNPGQMKAYWATVIFTGRGTPPAATNDSVEVRSVVANTPGMIGYIDSTEVDDTVKVVLTLP